LRGLDTETHLGLAVLIGTSDNYCLFPSTFEECLEFLLSIGDTEMCCWNADYDIAAILKFLKPGVLERLYRLGKWTLKNVRLESWSMPGSVSLHYVPRKFLKVKAGKKKFTVYDLEQFYHMSLNKASKQFLKLEKKDPGVAWSELKAILAKGGERAKKIIDYCKHDARLVELLSERTAEQFEKIGIPFDRPISCASLSYRVFKSELQFHLPREHNEKARESFRGGMIECLQTGYFKQAYYIDIRSAYPAAIRDLTEMPAIWKPIENTVDSCAVYGSVECAVHVPRQAYKGHFPYVPAGLCTFYPVGVWRTWLDLYTFRKAQALGMVEKVYGGIQGIAHSERQPFKERVEELYLERQKDAQKKWAIKIVLNSLYGKFAETREHATPLELDKLEDLEQLKLVYDRKERFTNHTNFFMASEITARTRWRLLKELDPRKVIFYATDGVFLTEKPIGLDYGNELGQWSEPETMRDLVVVGSGVYCYRYWNDDHKQWENTTRFRGFQSDLDLYTLLDRRRHKIPIKLQRNQKLGQTVITQRWDLFNVIQLQERELDVNFDRKRCWEKAWLGRDLLKRSFHSEPWQLFDERILQP
jgi:hypothetical protein